jgi:hypothetical protein
MNILIVRLGALGDVVHAIPAAAALRAKFPDARIDWLVDARHQEMVSLVTAIDRAVVVGRASIAGWTDAVRRLRQVRYDVALDLQGLLKSAVLARASGAARVIGFSIWHLREKTARPFYSEAAADDDGSPEHVIQKNLRLLRTIGVDDDRVAFPLAHVGSAAAASIRSAIGDQPFALINPGGAWPNKRWPPARFERSPRFCATSADSCHSSCGGRGRRRSPVRLPPHRPARRAWRRRRRSPTCSRSEGRRRSWCRAIRVRCTLPPRREHRPSRSSVRRILSATVRGRARTSSSPATTRAVAITIGNAIRPCGVSAT